MRRFATLAASIAIPMMLIACKSIPMIAQSAIIQPSTPKPATETRTFALQSDGKLKVSNVNGNIRITAWDKNEVALSADFKPDSNDNHVSIEVESNSHSLELIAKYPKDKNIKKSASCDMELKVPRRIISNISTVNGKVLLDALTGENTASTVNGNVALENISGRINASTVNGSINGNINNVEDNLKISTVNGSIKISLLNPDGILNASTVNGSVKLHTPGAKDIEVKKHNIKAKFADGRTNMKFSTVNGSIVIE